MRLRLRAPSQQSIYNLYPEELGMSADEFMQENRIMLRDLTKKIIRNYKISIASQHSGPLHAAIRFFLESMNRRDHGLGMGVNRQECQAKVKEYKANKPAFKWQEA